MKGTVHLVVNEGFIVYATDSAQVAECKAASLSEEATNDAINESGRDADDLTPEEVAEFSFSSGFDGGYYYTDSVEVPEDYDPDDEFEMADGTYATFAEVEAVYENSEDVEYVF